MNNGAPYDFTFINQANAEFIPSAIHVKDAFLTRFFAKYLLQKAMSVFKWKLPPTWSKDYFLYTLYTWGFVAIVNTNKYGVIPQQCSLQGWDIFYRPTNVNITNPLLRGFLTPKIDVQCTLIKLQPDYTSIMDIVNLYAGLMSLCVETASTNLVNSKLSYIAYADNKATAETVKSVYDDIASGEPAVVVDKTIKDKMGEKMFNLFNHNVGQNYIVSDILVDLRKIENMFNTHVGIKNANTDKRERLIEAEVEANNEETTSIVELWLEQLQEACVKTRNMFGIDIAVDWRNKEPEVKEVEKDGE